MNAIFFENEGPADSKGIQLLDSTLGKNITIVKTELIFMAFVFPLALQMLLQVSVWDKCLLVE